MKLGIPVVGAIGILIRGKQRGRVDAVGPLLVRLREQLNFRISDDLMLESLRAAGE